MELAGERRTAFMVSVYFVGTLFNLSFCKFSISHPNKKIKVFYFGMLFIFTFGNAALNLGANIVNYYEGDFQPIYTDKNFFNGPNFFMDGMRGRWFIMCLEQDYFRLKNFKNLFY